MLQKELLPDAQRYADDEETIRALPERMKFYDARQQLLGLAELYEKLAKLAEEVTLHSLSAAALIATHDLKKNERLPIAVTSPRAG